MLVMSPPAHNSILLGAAPHCSLFWCDFPKKNPIQSLLSSLQSRSDQVPMLSFKDVLAVTQNTITVQSMSHKGGEAASHRSAMLVPTRRHSHLPHIVPVLSHNPTMAVTPGIPPAGNHCIVPVLREGSACTREGGGGGGPNLTHSRRRCKPPSFEHSPRMPSIPHRLTGSLASEWQAGKPKGLTAKEPSGANGGKAGPAEPQRACGSHTQGSTPTIGGLGRPNPPPPLAQKHRKPPHTSPTPSTHSQSPCPGAHSASFRGAWSPAHTLCQPLPHPQHRTPGTPRLERSPPLHGPEDPLQVPQKPSHLLCWHPPRADPAQPHAQRGFSCARTEWHMH